MKLSIKLLALLVIAGFVGCVKSDPVEPNVNPDVPTVDENGRIAVSIQASVGASTKVSTDVNTDYGLDFGWEMGDHVAFIPSSGASDATSSILEVTECNHSNADLTGDAKIGVKNRLVMYPSNTSVSSISYNGSIASLDVSYQNWDMEGMKKSYERFADAMYMINDDGERPAITLENAHRIPTVNFAHINACLTLRISFERGSLGDYADCQYKFKSIVFQNMPVKADIDLTKNPGDANFMTNIETDAMTIELSNSPFVEEGSDVGSEYWIPVPIFASKDFKKEYELTIVLERQDGDQTRTAYKTVTIAPDYAELVAGTNNAVQIEVEPIRESKIGGMLKINEILCDPNAESEFVDFNDQDFIELMNVSDESITWEAGQLRMTAYNDGQYTDIDLESIENGVVTDGSDKVPSKKKLKPGYYFVQKGKAGEDIIHSTQNFIIVSENIATKADGSVDADNPIWIPIETLKLSAMNVPDTHTLRYSFGYKTSAKEYLAAPDNKANAWGIPEKGCTYGRVNSQLGDNVYINEYKPYDQWVGGLFGHQENNWIELYNSTIDKIELLVVMNESGSETISGVQIYRKNGGQGQSDDMYTIENDNRDQVILASKGYYTMSRNDAYMLSLVYNYKYNSKLETSNELVLTYGKWQTGSVSGYIIIDTVPIWNMTSADRDDSFARDLQSRNWYIDDTATKSKANNRGSAPIVYTRPTTDVPVYTEPE